MCCEYIDRPLPADEEQNSKNVTVVQNVVGRRSTKASKVLGLDTRKSNMECLPISEYDEEGATVYNVMGELGKGSKVYQGLSIPEKTEIAFQQFKNKLVRDITILPQ